MQKRLRTAERYNGTINAYIREDRDVFDLLWVCAWFLYAEERGLYYTGD